jgi:hypothetical protein
MRFGINALLQNFATTRTAWLRKLLDPRRDIAAECGHPEVIEVLDYALSFERGDLAKRIVTIFPEESWSESPEVVEDETDNETTFEKAWKELEEQLRMWSYLQRADILSGVGRFGVLLLGFDDGGELSTEVQGKNNKLLYIRPFEEALIDISTIEQDVTNPRFGLPNTYNIRFVDSTTVTGETQTARAISVHWSRVIHMADNRQNSDVYGQPRMKPVFNRLLDLRKIAGGSGEMFWKGGFPGLSLEAANPDDDVEFDEAATKEKMDQYMNGMQRYISLVGMTAKSLSPQVADPSAHVEIQMKLIASALGIPWRIFIGSEAAQLASSQDMKAWNRRINRRRNEYVTPFIIRPLIDRLMLFGPLPETAEYEIKWPDLNTPTDLEKAEVADKITAALSKYVTTGIDAMVPPFHYLTLVLKMTDEEANGILKEAGDRIEELMPDDDLLLPPPPGAPAQLPAPGAPGTPRPPAPAPPRANQ